MSIEYTAGVTLNDREGAELVAKLSDGDFVLLPGGHDGHFRFRIASNSPRETWPEDIELRLRPHLYVAFHSATRDERERFVQRLESLLAKMGYQSKLVED